MSDSCSKPEECAENKNSEQNVTTELSTSVSSESHNDDRDSFEEHSSSEDWTIIDKKESTSNSISDFNIEKELEGPNETVVSEEACDTKESSKVEIEHVEEGEEAGEKELESDDVSILSDESEIDQISFEEGRIERVEWQVDRRNSVEELLSSVRRTDDSNDTSISVHALLTCSVVALILGILIAGQIGEFNNERATYAMNPEMAAKIKKLSGIDEKLRELKEVKQAIEKIQISMPEMELLRKQLNDGGFQGRRSKRVIHDFKTMDDLKLNSYDDKLEILDATYKQFCSIANKLNSSILAIENEACRTPKILSGVFAFKKGLQEAFDKTEQRNSPEKQMFVDIERKIDTMVDAVLSDFSMMFSRFSLRLNLKFATFSEKLRKRLCVLSNDDKSDDEFLKIVLNNKYILNHCKNKGYDEFESYARFNLSRKVNKSKIKIKSYETQKKMDAQNEHQNENNDKNSREIHAHEKDSDEDFTIDKSVNRRGEVKYDNNWKNDNYYSKNKYYQNDKYYNKDDANSKRKNSEMSSDYKNSSKNYQKNTYKSKYEKKQNGTEYKQDRDIVYKQDSSMKKNIQGPKVDYKKDEYKSHEDYIYYDENLNIYNRAHERNNYERRKNFDPDAKFYEPNNIYHPEFDQTFEKYLKNDYYYKQENKKDRGLDQNYKNHKKLNDNTNSKYFENVDQVRDGYSENYSDKKKYKQYEKQFPKQENFKESKYTKYQSAEVKEKDLNQISGDWQMQRGESREKLRNPDWYYVQADSRRKNRFQHVNSQIFNLEREVEENKNNKLPQRPPRYHLDDDILYDYAVRPIEEPSGEKFRRHDWKRY